MTYRLEQGDARQGMGGMTKSENKPDASSPQQWPPAGVDWYYADDWACIAHGDCREILPSLPKVDLVLTDPPYGTGWAPRGGRRAGTLDLNSGDHPEWDRFAYTGGACRDCDCMHFLKQETTC